MQEPRTIRSNRDRTEATRSALIAAARALFVDKGYGATSTPEIVAAAGVTRGALYHHFDDKKDLFRAVVGIEAKTLAEEIERTVDETISPREALLRGSRAYLDAMRVPGRTRLLLIEGPAVLGSAEMTALDEAHAARTLTEGLRAVSETIETSGVTPAILSKLLSAAFDRAALAVEAGESPDTVNAAMAFMIERVVGSADR